MIRQAYRDGWLLVPQPAHAWLAGVLAGHWGNADVSVPRPYRSVVLATTLHDNGWVALDGQPLMNNANEPMSFLEPELHQVSDMYAATVANVNQIDPYAGVLVNRHVQVIYNSRVTHGRDTAEAVQPLMDHLRDREQFAMAQLKDHPVYADFLDESTLNHNYRILRTCDLLVLILCEAFRFDTMSDVALRYGEGLVDVSIERVDQHTFRLSPYLFDEPELDVHVDARYMDRHHYDTAEALSAAYATAPLHTLNFRLVGA